MELLIILAPLVALRLLVVASIFIARRFVCETEADDWRRSRRSRTIRSARRIRPPGGHSRALDRLDEAF